MLQKRTVFVSPFVVLAENLNACIALFPVGSLERVQVVFGAVLPIQSVADMHL